VVADRVPWAKRSVRKHVFFAGGPFEGTVERRFSINGILFFGVGVGVIEIVRRLRGVSGVGFDLLCVLRLHSRQALRS